MNEERRAEVIRRAHEEYEETGTLAVDTYIALTSLGIDPSTIAEAN